MNELKVISSEEGVGSKKVGLLEFNAPKSLNAVDGEMLNKISQKIRSWEQNKSIACIVIYSKSDKAFCAGGDVKHLVTHFKTSSAKQVAEQFFTTEYFTDYLIHVTGKPVVCFADGVTMGGGMGIMQGAKVRVVSERSLLAMPEISIGLFPDVGGGYFLNKIPNHIGLFLGITGARFIAGDAIRWGLADYMVESKNKLKIITDLLRINWTDDNDDNLSLIRSYFKSISSAPPEMWRQIEDTLIELANSASLEKLSETLLNLEVPHKGFTDAKNFFKAGSPLSKRLIYSSLVKMRTMPLRKVFEFEWNMAIECSLNNDFPEGVRALLIDKSNNPKWEHDHIPPEAAVQKYFAEHEPHLLRKRFQDSFY